MKERRKEPREGSEIEPETAYIQTVGAPFVEWLRTFCIMGQRLTFCGELNRVGEAQRKRVRTERPQSQGVDPKPDELSMARLKVW